MFDIGGFELLIIAVVGLLVIGPERLPETLRTLGLWLGRLRRSFTAVKAEIEKEVGMDEVKRQLHNEAVMEEMQRIERDVKGSIKDARIDPGAVTGTSTVTTPGHDNNTNQSETVNDEPGQAGDHSDAAEPQEPAQPAAPIPPTDAELEAAYERKRRAGQSSAEDNA